jgi:hypothetical protein
MKFMPDTGCSHYTPQQPQAPQVKQITGRKTMSKEYCRHEWEKSNDGFFEGKCSKCGEKTDRFEILRKEKIKEEAINRIMELHALRRDEVSLYIGVAVLEKRFRDNTEGELKKEFLVEVERMISNCFKRIRDDISEAIVG